MNDSSTLPTKTCATCGSVLPATSAFFGAERSGHLKTSCRECGRAYGALHYAKNKAATAARQASYRAAHREELRERSRAYNAAHTVERADYRLAHRAERNASDAAYRREGAAGLMYRLWREAGCAVCGEDNPLVVQAHHHDPNEKESVVSHITRVPAMERELAKCAPLCANHHILVHARMRATGETSYASIAAILDAGV